MDAGGILESVILANPHAVQVGQRYSCGCCPPSRDRDVSVPCARCTDRRGNGDYSAAAEEEMEEGGFTYPRFFPSLVPREIGKDS